MEWTKAEKRPKKDCRLLIHVWESPFFSFRGLDKLNCVGSFSISRGSEYVTEAYYEPYGDTWEFINEDNDETIINGIYALTDYGSSVREIKIIEWQNLPKFTPVNADFQPITDEYNCGYDKYGRLLQYGDILPSEDAKVISKYFSDFTADKYKSSKRLEKCDYKDMENGEHPDIYIELKDEEDFNALVTYCSLADINNKTGRITLKKPLFTNFEGSGLYKIFWNSQKEIYQFIKVDSVKEMFDALK